jgi:hypothetical protein
MMKTIQVQLTITLDEAAAKTLTELLAPAIKQTIGLTANESDQRREARLRDSQNAIFGGEKLPEDQGLLIDYNEAAKLLKVSQKTVNRMHTTSPVVFERFTPKTIPGMGHGSLASVTCWK